MNRVPFYRLWLLTLAGIFWASFALAADLEATGKVQAGPPFYQTLHAYGELPVILHLDTRLLPAGKVQRFAKSQAQRLRITERQERLLAKLQDHQVKRVKRFKHIPYLAVTLDEPGLAEAAADPDILAIYEDRLSAPLLTDSLPLIGAEASGVFEDTATEAFSGLNQVVAVLDTGVDASHPFLADKVIYEACFSTTNSQYTSSTVCPDGREWQVGGGAGADCPAAIAKCNHGTHVAGIAAGDSQDFTGVAKDAEIIAVQVFSQFSSDQFCQYETPCALSWTSDQLLALEHIYSIRNDYRIASVNLSLGVGSYAAPCDLENPAYTDVIDLLTTAGIATVAASGNAGDSTGISFPACISSAVSVGATSKADAVSDFSNSSATLDLLAPGQSIQSAVPGGGYDFFSGTSMAAPHVAGAFAVLRQKDGGTTSTAELLAALQDSGLALYDNRNGITTSRLQVDQALDQLTDPSSAAVLASAPSTGLTAIGEAGATPSPVSAEYTLSNVGGSPLLYSITASVAWLDITPDSGSLAPAEEVVVTVGFNDAASDLNAGAHSAVLAFDNLTNGEGNSSRPVSLTLVDPAEQNDKFIKAIEVHQSSGSTIGSNSNAGKETGEPDHGGNAGGRSVWWQWTAPASGELAVTTEESSFDTLLAVYTGTSVAGLTLIAENDDSGASYQSAVRFTVEQGLTYRIAVDGHDGASGTIRLRWNLTQELPAQEGITVTPERDFIAAGPRGGPFSPQQSLYHLTNISSSALPFALTNLPDWLVADPHSGILATGESRQVKLFLAPTAADLPPGTYLQSFSMGGKSLAAFLTVTGSPPDNDAFAQATVLPSDLPVTVAANNGGATRENGEPAHAGNLGGKSLWWVYYPTVSDTLQISTRDSTFDTLLAVYTGDSVDRLTPIAANDDANGGKQSHLTFAAIKDTGYYICVDGYYGDFGTIKLKVTSATHPQSGKFPWVLFQPAFIKHSLHQP